MAKKYLNLEEAAGLLDMTTEQLMKIREQGDIRGFADRGSWKFREQDIDEFQRSRQADSSPNFPIITSDSSSSILEVVDEDDLSSSDSDVRLFFDESLFDGTDMKGLETSGSDLRLTGDSGPNLEGTESADDLDLSAWGNDGQLSDSDSDVKLFNAATEPEIDLRAKVQSAKGDESDVVMVTGKVALPADSEFKFSDSDSDVRMSTGDDDSDINLVDDQDLTATAHFDVTDSDSDVNLMGSEGLLLSDHDSDSDVKLSADVDRTDRDMRLAEPSPALHAKISPASTGKPTADPKAKPQRLKTPPDDSDLKLINKGSGVRKDRPDSGISLSGPARGSGIGLEADESGISLEMDSGISLEADDSGISLESFDSGISLEGFESGTSLGNDKGISFNAEDSGISLEPDEDSGISMQSEDLSRTMPMQGMKGMKGAKPPVSDSTSMTTQFEIPKSVSGHDSEFELAGLDDDDEVAGSNTGVLTFDEVDESDESRTMAIPALSVAAAKDEVDEADDVEFEDEESSYDDDGEEEEFEDDGDLDVHDSEGLEDDNFESGQSQVAGFPVPMRAGRADVDWGIGTKIMIGISTLVSVMCAVVGIELVRTMWMWTQTSGDAPVSSILQMIGGAF